VERVIRGLYVLLRVQKKHVAVAAVAAILAVRKPHGAAMRTRLL
jgi:hypothetical protein